MSSGTAPSLAAIVLAGGTAARLGGVDKATVEYAGSTLLDHVLAAAVEADTVVVVGPEVPGARFRGEPVRFTREDPPLGGPAAGLLAGVDALDPVPDLLLVVAVDMPGVTTRTVERLLAAAVGADGAFLTDGTGRRQLAGVLRADRLPRIAPADRAGLPLHRLLELLDLARVAAVGREARDVDTWDDLADLREGGLR